MPNPDEYNLISQAVAPYVNQVLLNHEPPELEDIERFDYVQMPRGAEGRLPLTQLAPNSGARLGQFAHVSRGANGSTAPESARCLLELGK